MRTRPAATRATCPGRSCPGPICACTILGTVRGGDGRDGGSGRTGIAVAAAAAATICAKKRFDARQNVSKQGAGKGKAGVVRVLAARTFVERVERPRPGSPACGGDRPQRSRPHVGDWAAMLPGWQPAQGPDGTARANFSRRASCRRPQTRRQRTHALCVCCRQVGAELPPPRRAQEVHADRGQAESNDLFLFCRPRFVWQGRLARIGLSKTDRQTEKSPP